MKRQKVTIYLSENNVRRLEEASNKDGVDESVFIAYLIANYELWIKRELAYKWLLEKKVY